MKFFPVVLCAAVAAAQQLTDPCASVRCPQACEVDAAGQAVCVSANVTDTCTPYTLQTEDCAKDQCYSSSLCSCQPMSYVRCADACSTAGTKCDTGFKCVSNYCGSCSFQCVKEGNTTTPVDTKPPAPTDKPTDKPACVQCFAAPCQVAQCDAGLVCEADDCACTHKCVKPAQNDTKPPTPTDKPACPQCLVAPCQVAQCDAGLVCEADDCACTHKCVKPAPMNTTAPTVHPCATLRCSMGCEVDAAGNAYCVQPSKNDTKPPTPTDKPCVQCFAAPCQVAQCDAGLVCEADDCACTHKCVKPAQNDTKPPTPATCTPYNESKMCIALAGWCYNPAKCECGDFGPLADCDACKTAKCEDNYKCVSSGCGGCSHQCVKEDIPKPTDLPAKECETASGELVKDGASVRMDCNTCTCSNGMLRCTKMACPAPTDKPTDKPACVQCFAAPCQVAQCDAGLVCESDDCACTHKCVKPAQNDTKPPVASGCTTDADCGASEWCRTAVLPTTNAFLECADSAVRECVKRVGVGASCNGFTLPCATDRCEEGLECPCADPTCDLPGKCQKPTDKPTPVQNTTAPAPCLQVRCKENPCNLADCAPGFTCKENYCGGCNFECVKEDIPKPTDLPAKECKTASGELVKDGASVRMDCNTCTCSNGMLRCTKMACPAPTDKPTDKPACVQCFAAPCQVAQCDAGLVCEADDCACTHKCVKPAQNDTKPPTPATCTPYNESKMCIALAGWCYNPAKCECGDFGPLADCDACKTAKCEDNYKCVSSGCGGCSHQCVKEDIPKPTDLPAKECETASGELVKDGASVRMDCNTCTCSNGMLMCTKMACPAPTDKPTDKPACVQCFAAPCQVAQCDAGLVCEADDCACTHKCVKPAPMNTTAPTVHPCATLRCSMGCEVDAAGNAYCVQPSKNDTKPPTPTDKPACPQCFVAPCQVAKCDAGLVCEADDCACTHKCVKPAQNDTKPPVDGENCKTSTGMIKHGTSGKVDCNTCRCFDGKLACTKMYCPPTKEKSCKMDNGKMLKHNESTAVDCNTCTCMDGYLMCTEMACAKPSCTLENGEVVKEGERFKKDCNTCWCNGGKVGCTEMACGAPTNYTCDEVRTLAPWTHEQRLWCCENKKQGCTVVQDKREKCMAAEKSGATVDAAFKADCCNSSNVMCPEPKFADCSAPKDDEREWCCRVMKKGCTMTCDAQKMDLVQATYCCNTFGSKCTDDYKNEQKTLDKQELKKAAKKVWKQIKQDVKGAIEDIFENPKAVLRRIRMTLFRGSATLAQNPQNLVVTLIAAYTKDGQMPPTDVADQWRVDIPHSWNEENHAEEHAVVADKSWSTSGTSDARAAVVLQSGDSDQKYYFEYRVEGTDEQVGQSVAEMEESVGSGKLADNSGGMTVPVGSTMPIAVTGASDKPEESSESSDSGMGWLFAVIGSLGALCMGGLVAFVIFQRKQRQQAENELYAGQMEELSPSMNDSESTPMRECGSV